MPFALTLEIVLGVPTLFCFVSTACLPSSLARRVVLPYPVRSFRHHFPLPSALSSANLNKTYTNNVLQSTIPSEASTARENPKHQRCHSLPSLRPGSRRSLPFAGPTTTSHAIHRRVAAPRLFRISTITTPRCPWTRTLPLFITARHFIIATAGLPQARNSLILSIKLRSRLTRSAPSRLPPRHRISLSSRLPTRNSLFLARTTTLQSRPRTSNFARRNAIPAPPSDRPVGPARSAPNRPLRTPSSTQPQPAPNSAPTAGQPPAPNNPLPLLRRLRGQCCRRLALRLPREEQLAAGSAMDTPPPHPRYLWRCRDPDGPQSQPVRGPQDRRHG